MRTEVQSDQSSLVVISLDQPAGLLCHLSIILSTDTELHVKEFWASGEHRVTFAPPTTRAEEWDLLERGPRSDSTDHGGDDDDVDDDVDDEDDEER